MQWAGNVEVIAAAEGLDGFYGLLTILPAEQADASEVLRIRKRQSIAERWSVASKARWPSAGCS